MNIRFSHAQEFIWKNARLIDRALFACLFCGGAPQAVATGLKAYQNPDGGFGNALEPDKRVPDSQPQDVDLAFHLLDRVGLLGDAQFVRAMVLPACDFLETITTGEGGVPFTLPSANGYPRAPWWTSAENPPASLNPTAEICAVLLKNGIRHPWLEHAEAYCWQAIAATETQEYHELMPIISFLESVPDRARAEPELRRIADRVRRAELVELDPQAGGYVKMPLDWAPHPESFCRSLFSDEVLTRHLEALASRQGVDGGWPISWDAISPGVELEWRGRLTIDALDTLRAYEKAGFAAPE